MSTEPLTICVAGPGGPPSEVAEALAADGRRAVIVPWATSADGSRPGRAATLGPWATLRATRSGRFVGPPADMPTASAIAVPTTLLDAIGGPDPRFGSAVGWADLIDRLRIAEPDLVVVDAEPGVGLRPSEPDPDRFRTDLYLHAANRPSVAWRLAARLVRPGRVAGPPSVGEELRRLVGPSG